MNYSKIFTSIYKNGKKDGGCFAVILACIIVLGLIFGFDCLIVWACMALWNGCLVPILAGTALAIGPIKFWPMFGIYLLFGFLFRSHNVNTTTTSDNE